MDNANPSEYRRFQVRRSDLQGEVLASFDDIIDAIEWLANERGRNRQYQIREWGREVIWPLPPPL